jgi:hypothetical protein
MKDPPNLDDVSLIPLLISQPFGILTFSPRSVELPTARRSGLAYAQSDVKEGGDFANIVSE